MSGVGVTRDSCNVETDEDDDIMGAIVIEEEVDSIFYNKDAYVDEIYRAL